MTRWFHLAVGSLAGGFCRYWTAGAVYRMFGTDFPYGTFVVNVSGCFLIGWFNGLAEDKLWLGSHGRMLWMIGFCGAYTTFSTFLLETSNLVTEGQFARAAGNIGASLILGFAALRLGGIVGKLL